MSFKYTDEYICTHLGDEEERHHGAVIPPIFQTSLHVFKRVEDMEAPELPHQKRYVYGRTGNPTVELLERKIAALEGGEAAKCFASGMAAITSALLTFLASGDHLICIRNVYDPSRIFITDYLQKFGIEATFVCGDRLEDFEGAIRENTRLIYLESPSSQIFLLQDLKSVAELAHRKNIRIMVDNTWATPIFQKPLELGIDVVVHSLSKYMGGHSDVIAGAAAGSHEIIEKIASNERQLLGGILGPFDAWLLMRGMRTLTVRMRQHQENAFTIAQYLVKQKRVKKVHYPGLPEHPQYDLGKRQMRGYSGLMSFELEATTDEIKKFLNRLRIFQIGVSWGGFESLAVQGIYPGLVRIAVGLENVDEIIADLADGLAELD